MQRNIRVLVVEPYKEPYEKVIPNTLEAKQDIVGGYIEYTRADNDENAMLIVNEEGKIMGLPWNREYGYNDIIAGTFLVVGDDADIGEDRSLSDEQIEQYKKRFDMSSIEKMEQILTEKYLENKKNYEYEI